MPFSRTRQVDSALDVGVRARQCFRVNAFQQRGKLAVAARRVITRVQRAVPPETMSKICEFREGGAACGRDGWAIYDDAAMLDRIGVTACIVTVETRSYLFTDKKAWITSVRSASTSTASTMPEVPMRDLDTCRSAMRPEIRLRSRREIKLEGNDSPTAAASTTAAPDLFPESERRAMRQR